MSLMVEASNVGNGCEPWRLMWKVMIIVVASFRDAKSRKPLFLQDREDCMVIQYVRLPLQKVPVVGGNADHSLFHYSNLQAELKSRCLSFLKTITQIQY